MLDEVIYGEKINPKILANELKFDQKKPIIIILQHPVSFEYELAKEQMEKTLRAAEKLKFQTYKAQTRPIS